jgi:spoIIIJ-associated protein
MTMAKGAERTAAKAAETFVGGVLERLGSRGLKVKATTSSEDTVVVQVTGDVAGLQRNRELVAALSLLAGQVASRVGNDRWRCLLDVGGELDERKSLLEGVAAEVAEAVARTGRRAVIESLSAGERRIVHTALVEDGRVATRSEGDEEHRMLLVEPKA